MSEFVRIIDPSGKTLRNDLYNSPPDAASYIIFKDRGLVKAKNGRTGQIEFSGTDASQVIQSAIDALPNGGKILIKDGIYVIKSSIRILNNNVQLWGESWNTILRRDSSLDDSIIWVGKYEEQARVDNVVVANIQLDGNKGAGGIETPVKCKGVCFHSGAAAGKTWANPELFGWNNVAYRIYAHDCGSEGISFDYQIGAKCIECRAENNDWFDIAVYKTKWADVRGCITNGGVEGGYNLDGLRESTVANCISLNHSTTDAFGFRCHSITDYPAENVVLVGCISENDYIPFSLGSYVEGELAYGLIWANGTVKSAKDRCYLRKASHCQVVDSIFQNGQTEGLLVWGSQRCLVMNNIFRNQGVASDNTYDVIRLTRFEDEFNSSHNIIAFNEILTDSGVNRPRYGILEGTQCDYNLFLHNKFENVGTSPYYITDSTHSLIIGLRTSGYVTKNSGTATIPAGQTSVTFPHGLAGTPTSVVLGPTHDEVTDAVWSADDTNITITVPSAVSADRQISWYAEYKP